MCGATYSTHAIRMVLLVDVLLGRTRGFVYMQSDYIALRNARKKETRG